MDLRYMADWPTDTIKAHLERLDQDAEKAKKKYEANPPNELRAKYELRALQEEHYAVHTFLQERLRKECRRQIPSMHPMRTGLESNGYRAGDELLAPSSEWRAKDGTPVYLLNREQRVSDIPTRQYFADFDSESTGRLLRAIITGDSKHAPAEIRALSEGVNTGGGFLVPEQLATNVIDLARNDSVLNQAGMQTIPMDSETLIMAKVTGDPTMYATAENAAMTESASTFGALTFTARKFGTYVVMSRELAEDAPNAATLLQSQLAAAMAVTIDSHGLTGSGGTEPLGVENYPGVGTTGSTGSIATDWYDKHFAAIETIEEANGLVKTWIMAPGSWTFFRKLKTGDGTNSAKAYFAIPEPFASMQRLVTNQASAGVSYLGDFSKVMMGVRRSARIEISTDASDFFTKDQVGIKITWRGDFGIGYPDHLHVLSGLSA